MIDLTKKIKRNLDLWYDAPGKPRIRAKYVSKAGPQRPSMCFIKLRDGKTIYVHQDHLTAVEE